MNNFHLAISSQAFPCLEKVNHAKQRDVDSAPTNSIHTPLHRILSASQSGSHNDLELDKALAAATQQTKTFLNPSHPMFASLKGDLTKLLTIVMRQSAFLRRVIPEYIPQAFMPFL